MESLSDSQQESLHKMSSERIQGRLMRAGMDEERVYDMGRPQLLEAMANVMLEVEMADTAVPTNPDPKTELQLQFQMMHMQLEQRDRELEQRDREHAREMQLQREWFDGQLKMQMHLDQQAREENMRRQVEREETLVAKTKRYGQAVQYALANMPGDAGELPAWFDMVDNVWTTYGVPDDLKSKLIIPKLTTRAKSLLTQLSVSDQASYPKLKEYLLKQYQLGSREYRARFLHASRNTGETWVSFASRLANLFKYYTDSRNCKDFQKLFDLCVTDKLRDSLPHANLKHCLTSGKDEALSSQELAQMADQYESNFFPDGRYKGLSVTAGVGQSGGKGKQFSNEKNMMTERVDFNPVATGASTDRGTVLTKSPPAKRNWFSTPLTSKSPIKCWKCGALGHTSKAHYDPLSPHYSGNRPPGKPIAVNACSAQTSESVAESASSAQDAVPISRCVVLEHGTEHKSCAVNAQERLLPNLVPEVDQDYEHSERGITVRLEPECVTKTCGSGVDINGLIPALDYVSIDLEGSERTYTAMVDSGAMVAVAKSSLIPQELGEPVGKTRLQGAFGECVDAELSMLKIRLHQQSETVYIPMLFALTDALASKDCDMLLPAHAIRELRAYGEVFVVTNNDLSAHNPSSNVVDDDVVLDSTSIDSDDDLDQDCEVENVDVPPIKIVDPSNRDLLIKEQHDDKSLTPFWQMAKQNKGRMFIKQGLLYHRDTVGGLPVEQLAVPVNRREEVIRLAHQTLTGGHMRAQKTRERLKLHFFFPGMRKQVFASLAHCRECQLRARQKLSDNVPISPIVRPTLPFMVAHADLIGPLDPVSSQGHAHALCIVDACTRWPTVYLLRSTHSKAICDCFIDLFQHTGMYQIIIMDNGPNLCSKLTTEFMNRLGVSPRFITPYHSQANGLVERFNQSFKTMLHYAMREHGRAWHKAVPFLVWCMREIPNATLGVSPFVMQYGVQLRGVLGLIKDHWSGFQTLPTSKPVEQYLTELKKQLETTREFAEQHAKAAQEQYAKYYNVRARDKTFSVDEEVIILEKDHGSKTFARWQTGKIVKVLSPYSYIVALPNGSRRHLHANRLRKLVLNAYHIGVIYDKDTEFGDVKAAPTQCDTDKLPSELVDISALKHLPDEQCARLLSLLDEFHVCFSNTPGLCTEIQHHIHTTSDFKPRQTRAYRVPELLKAEIECQVEELLRLGFIERSDSPMTSGVVCVIKPDKSVRMCCDYRYLNSFTIPDAMPMQIISDCIHRVSQAKFITISDAKSGFWQVEIAPEDRWKTAFVTHHGEWQWKRMPFGLRNAPGTFVRLMHILLHPIRDSSDAYMDDAWTISDDFESHLIDLRKFLTVIRDSGLTLSIAKCKFAQMQVRFVGYIVGGGKFSPDPAKTEAISHMVLPQTKKGIRHVLGVFSFYRNHVKDFAQIAKPLTDLTSSKTPAHPQITEVEVRAFEELKRCICEAPVLVAPRFGSPFRLYTDASQFSVGCCLAQADEHNVEHAIAYGSQKLTPTQCAWSAIEREAFAVIWSLNRFRTIIFGSQIMVFTDHNPLKYLTECSPKNAKLTRWCLALQEFDIIINYTKGSANTIADGLSRIS